MTKKLEQLVKAVLDADTDNFVELVKIAGLDPKTDFRASDLTGAEFNNCDLTEFDFLGCDIQGVDFSGAKIDPKLTDALLLADFRRVNGEKKRTNTAKRASPSAFLKACSFGNLEEVFFHIDNGIDPNYAEPKHLMNGIVLASRGGHYETALWLVHNGANPNQPTKKGSTAQICASKNGHLDVLQMLHRNGASKDYQIPETDWTALMEACEFGQVKIVNYLLSEGASSLTANKAGNTAIHVASEYGQVDVVELLLKYDPSHLDLENEFGETPIMVAATNRQPEVVQFFAEQGAEINNVENFPLLLAAENGYQDVVAVLLYSGADINQFNPRNGAFPLLMAALNGHTKTVQKLIKAGANVNQVAAIDGFSPLLAASKNGHQEVLVILLQAGANPNQTYGEDVQTCLQMASAQGHVNIIELLKEYGAKS